MKSPRLITVLALLTLCFSAMSQAGTRRARPHVQKGGGSSASSGDDRQWRARDYVLDCTDDFLKRSHDSKFWAMDLELQLIQNCGLSTAMSHCISTQPWDMDVETRLERCSEELQKGAPTAPAYNGEKSDVC